MSEPLTVAEARARLSVQRAELVKRGGRSSAERAWQGVHVATRVLLVSMCTDRDAHAAGVLPWGAYSDAERDAMGAAARQIARDLSAAQALR